MLDDVKNLTGDDREAAHDAIGTLRNMFSNILRGGTALFDGDDARIIDVCQWEELAAEALYVIVGRKVVRVRFEAIETDDLPAFLNGEPGINVQPLIEPQDYVRAMLNAVLNGENIEIVRG